MRKRSSAARLDWLDVMIEKVPHVRNPLTVIAIFAGLAEVSGTIILPHLEKSVQATYVWFLMIFPVVLVGLFFGTLIFRHHVLYAPSDFKDEENFLNTFNPASMLYKLSGSANEDLTAAVKDGDVTVSRSDGAQYAGAGVRNEDSSALATDIQPDPSDAPSTEPVIERYDPPNMLARAKAARRVIAEDYALNQMAENYGVPLSRNVQPKELAGVVFDAVGVVGQHNVVLEAMYIEYKLEAATIAEVLNRFNSYYVGLVDFDRRNTEFVVVLVTPHKGRRLASDAHQIIKSFARRYIFRLKIEIVELPSGIPLPYVPEIGIVDPWEFKSDAKGGDVDRIKRQLLNLSSISADVAVEEIEDGSWWTIQLHPSTDPTILSKLRRAIAASFEKVGAKMEPVKW